MTVLGSAIEVVAQGHGHVKDELLVGFRHGVTGSKARAVYRALGGDSLEEIPQINVHRIRVPAHALEKVKQALSHRPEVEFVEENAILPLQQLTDDPRLAEQWHHFKIGAIQAWDVTPGDGSVIIAILDSGVDAAHPDLAGRVVAGYSPYDGTTNTSDHFGHGTKVAGTAAAAGDNATGVAGVAWNTRIMPIRVSDTSGYAYYSTIASGITWAVDRGARVLNISINGVAASSSITSAARYAMSKGAVVVAAAGNCGCVESTASNPYLISVSATTSTDSVASWSSRGDHVDVAAPGSGILTTTRGGGYASVSGTSFASPVTAGVVALMLSANPGLQPSEVEQILKATALDLGASGWDPSYGAGRVDALRAVVAAAETSPPADTTPPSVRIVAPASGSTAAGSLTVDASVSDDVGVTRVELWVDGALVASGTGTRFFVDTTRYVNGTHGLTVRAFDAAGNVGSASVSVTFANATTQDTVAPTVAITTISESKPKISVTVKASDNVKVAKVELYVDDRLYATSTSPEPTFSVHKRLLGSGSHRFHAKAYDTSGNTSSSAALSYVAR